MWITCSMYHLLSIWIFWILIKFKESTFLYWCYFQDNAVECFRRACKIFSIESEVVSDCIFLFFFFIFFVQQEFVAIMRNLELFVQLYIWDFSGQTANFLLNDNSKNTKDVPRQPEQDVSCIWMLITALFELYKTWNHPMSLTACKVSYIAIYAFKCCIINPSYTLTLCKIMKNTISRNLILKLNEIFFIDISVFDMLLRVVLIPTPHADSVGAASLWVVRFD